MTPDRQRVLAVLSRFVTQSTAGGILQWGVRESGIDPDRASDDQYGRLVEALESGIRPFISDRQRQQFRTELFAAAVTAAARARAFAIRTEEDVLRARLAARQICQECGAPSLTAQQAATCVSEVARNILLYARVGHVELAVIEQPRRAFTVRAVDRGGGIADLDEIYSGTYRSKTGQGRGISGVRRIANRFDLTTGPSGTRVEFDLWL